MLPDVERITGRPPGWSTAGLLSHSETKRFVGRLADHGIEYLMTAEGNFVRTAVPSNDLEQALALRPGRRGTAASPRSYVWQLLILVSIPIGVLAGRLLESILGFFAQRPKMGISES